MSQLFLLAKVFHQALFRGSIIFKNFKKLTDQCVFPSNDAFLPQNYISPNTKQASQINNVRI